MHYEGDRLQVINSGRWPGRFEDRRFERRV